MTTKTLENMNITHTNDEADNESIIRCCHTWTIDSIYEYVKDEHCAALLLHYATDEHCIAECMSVQFWFD